MDRRHLDKIEMMIEFGKWDDKYNDDDYEFEIITSNRNQTITITANRIHKFPIMEE